MPIQRISSSGGEGDTTISDEWSFASIIPTAFDAHRLHAPGPNASGPGPVVSSGPPMARERGEN
jgi:hypothetical protein